MDLRDIVWDGMDWIDLAQDRDQWRALVEWRAGKFSCTCTIDSFSRRAQLHGWMKGEIWRHIQIHHTRCKIAGRIHNMES
jgi:hypothetical protein